MRDRGSVVLIDDNKVGLIQRIRDGLVYYVFPGGGVEEGETPEECAKREALEELGIFVEVNECISKVEFNGTQYFYLSTIINGKFGTGQGKEYTDKKRDRGTYKPIWVEIERLPIMDVKPKAVALKVYSLFS